VHQFFPIWAILVIIIVGVGWHFALRSLVRQYNLSGVWHVLAWVAFALLAVLFRMVLLRHLR
jgi:hypothetical protein